MSAHSVTVPSSRSFQTVLILAPSINVCRSSTLLVAGAFIVVLYLLCPLLTFLCAIIPKDLYCSIRAKLCPCVTVFSYTNAGLFLLFLSALNCEEVCTFLAWNLWTPNSLQPWNANDWSHNTIGLEYIFSKWSESSNKLIKCEVRMAIHIASKE